jgi:hypothetical protein
MIFGAPASICFLESYFYEEEDLVQNGIFSDKAVGFYFDIGAHQVTRFSKTFFFYQKVWRDINIDAMLNSMKIFNQEKLFDVNLELAIMEKQRMAIYYEFNEYALNSFSETISLGRDGLRDYKIINRRTISGVPLSDILDKNISQKKSIDFLTIDFERFYFDVLKSNDWDRFRPRIIYIEIPVSNLDSLGDPISKYLLCRDYRFNAKILTTVFLTAMNF